MDSSKNNIEHMQTRNRFNFRNLSVQLSLIVIGIPTCVLILFEAYIVHNQTIRLEKDLDAFLKNEAVQLSASLSASLFNLDDQTTSMICKAALAKPQILLIKIWDGQRDYMSFKEKKYDEQYTIKKTKLIEYPIVFNSQPIGKLKIVVTTDLLEQQIQELIFKSFLQVVVLDLILGIVLILVLIVRFVTPLRSLEKSSKKIAAGDLNQAINVHRNDELGSLADNMILMRDAVKEKVESLEAEVQQHRKTTIALEKSEAFMRLIIDLIPHMIFVKDANGKFLVVNKAMADRFNKTVEDMTGRKHLDISLDKNQAEIALKDDQKVIQNQKTLSVLTESYGSEPESSKWFSTKKVPFTAPDGEAGIVGITSDISDVKHAELEVKKTKQYIDNIINSMPSALFSLDRNLNIVLWNLKAENLYGISTKRAIDQPLLSVLPQMKPYLDAIKNAVENQSQSYHAKQNRKAQKGEIYEDITVYPLAAGFEGAVIRVDDVTDQVRMEEMVVQSEKMLSIGGLAAGMAHEINNPLAGMMQNAQVIMQRIQEDIPASEKIASSLDISMDQIRSFVQQRGILRQLELIREAGFRASRIVRNMLGFSRKGPSVKSLENISQILDKTIELAESDFDLKKHYDFKKIEIVKEYDPLTPSVMCEVSKMQQVFFNILKNSAQAMQETASTVPPQFTLRIFPNGKHVRIEIQDNGPGMTQKVRKRIFEPFFTTKSVGKGTGLGMSVSYFIITDNHKGDMSVISEPGKGANFIIHLPIYENKK